MNRFNYILQKIASTEFSNDPFRHIQIDSFFKPEDFSAITSAPEVKLGPVKDDRDLIDKLHSAGFKEIGFPGTTTDLNKYLKWHKDRKGAKNSYVETCEGMGVTFRLQKTEPGSILREITDFFKSDVFLNAIAAKFGLSLEDTYPDLGLQKYLDGYEISPHPDVRKKAMTYMININPAPNSEVLDYHTHYLTFTPERAYATAFWRGNPLMDRCWVPWSWCQTRKRQTKNNSLVMFSPSDDTLHAVKASYDHLATQRTQFYGNLWFKADTVTDKPNWRDLDVTPTVERRNNMSLLDLAVEKIKVKARVIFTGENHPTRRGEAHDGYQK